jgi:hypothetical protein
MVNSSKTHGQAAQSVCSAPCPDKRHEGFCTADGKRFAGGRWRLYKVLGFGAFWNVRQMPTFREKYSGSIFRTLRLEEQQQHTKFLRPQLGSLKLEHRTNEEMSGRTKVEYRVEWTCDNHMHMHKKCRERDRHVSTAPETQWRNKNRSSLKEMERPVLG